jgi:hypothetical protein
VQLADGTLAFCNWGNRYNGTFRKGGWGDAQNFGNFLTLSSDMGKSWWATPPVSNDKGWNECFVVELPNSTAADPQLLEISRQSHAHAYGSVRFSGERLVHRTAPTFGLPDIDTPICEGSLVSHEGALYFSHPQSLTQRTNLTVHRSVDGGASWPVSVLVWGTSGAGYSGMAATAAGLALAFNEWPMGDARSAKDGPGQSIRFTMLAYAAFA